MKEKKKVLSQIKWEKSSNLFLFPSLWKNAFCLFPKIVPKYCQMIPRILCISKNKVENDRISFEIPTHLSHNWGHSEEKGAGKFK